MIIGVLKEALEGEEYETPETVKKLITLRVSKFECWDWGIDH